MATGFLRFLLLVKILSHARNSFINYKQLEEAIPLKM
jgi:hypothetical protein